MAVTQAKTGKAGNATIASVVIPITGWSGGVDVTFAESTDSGQYDSPSGNLYKAQLPGDQQVSGNLEGFYDTATTTADVSALIKNPANGPYALVLKQDGSTTWFSGNVDFSNFKTSVKVPGATVINWTADFKSNGKYTTLN